jgi:hemerythrin
VQYFEFDIIFLSLQEPEGGLAMALFEWSSDYELDIPQIDNQHKELVKMINTLYESIKEEHSSEIVNQTMGNLLDYVEIHFETEEAAMLQRHYPGYEDHLLLHENLRSKVLDLKKDQLQGREIATFELLNFLVDWLKNHITNADGDFGDFIRNRDRVNLSR